MGKRKRNPQDFLGLAAIAGVGLVAWKMGALDKLTTWFSTVGGGGTGSGGTGGGGTGGGTGGGGGVPNPNMSEDTAAQIIWNHDPQLRSIYQQNHPDWGAVQAVKDWWGWGPHEGAANLAAFVKQKGWS